MHSIVSYRIVSCRVDDQTVREWRVLRDRIRPSPIALPFTGSDGRYDAYLSQTILTNEGRVKDHQKRVCRDLNQLQKRLALRNVAAFLNVCKGAVTDGYYDHEQHDSLFGGKRLR